MLLNQLTKVGVALLLAVFATVPAMALECSPYGGCYSTSTTTTNGAVMQTYPNANQVYGQQPLYGQQTYYGQQPMVGQQVYVQPMYNQGYGQPYGQVPYGYGPQYQAGYDPYYDQQQQYGYGYSPYGYGMSPLNYYGNSLVNSLLGKILKK